MSSDDDDDPRDERDERGGLLGPAVHSTTTLLLDNRDCSPVTGLRKLPSGPRYRFDDFYVEDRAKRILVVGSAPTCDIYIRDRKVSSSHCLIERDDSQVLIHDCRSKNGTRINGLLIKVCHLVEGALLTVGRTTFVAYGERGCTESILIAAGTLEEFIHNAVSAYGTIHKAATGIGVSYSTLQGWLKNDRFAPRRAKRGSSRPSTPDSASEAASSPNLDSASEAARPSRSDGASATDNS